jgi:uncharacterized integral membrane protein/DNA-directed RNA polymerase subunit RPC12/RpoP
MLVICEECAKKYNIDETRIKGKKAQFSCRECGHIIVVEKPDPIEFSQGNQEISDEEAMAQVAAMPLPEHDEKSGTDGSVTTGQSTPASRRKGSSSGAYVTLLMGMEFLILSGTFLYLVLMYLPGIINNQQTTESIWNALILPFPLKLIGAAFLVGFIVPVLLALLRLKKC